MKSIAILISALVLFLALKPGIEAVWPQDDEVATCCGSDCVPKEANEEPPLPPSSNENDCDGHNCNPMKHCGCVISQFHPTSLQILAFYSPPKCAFDGHQVISSPHLSKIWQPPRIV